MKKSFIFSALAIIIILGVVFFSQQPDALKYIKNFSSYISKYAGASLSGGVNFNPFSNNAPNNSATTPTTTTVGESAKPTIDGTTTNNTNSDKLAIPAYSSATATTAQKIDSTTNNAATIPTPTIAEKVTVPEKPTISEKVTDSIKSGGEAIANTINVAKENISSAEKNIVNYFSDITTSVIKPGTPQNCPPVQEPAK